MKYKDTYPKILLDYASEHEFFGGAVSDVAKLFGVRVSTVHVWMNTHQEFYKAMDELRNKIDDNVENALLKAALGYTYEEKKIVKDGVSGDSEVVQAQVIQRYKPADSNAARFWLINRRAANWRDKQTVETEDNSVINIVFKNDEEKFL